MDRDTRKPWVRPLRPTREGDADRVFAVEGPGAEWLEGLRFTRDEAERIVASLTGNDADEVAALFRDELKRAYETAPRGQARRGALRPGRPGRRRR